LNIFIKFLGGDGVLNLKGFVYFLVLFIEMLEGEMVVRKGCCMGLDGFVYYG
jgi:hypothetical protein